MSATPHQTAPAAPHQTAPAAQATVSAVALARALARHEAVARTKTTDAGLTSLALVEGVGLDLRTATPGREASTRLVDEYGSGSAGCMVNAKLLRVVTEKLPKDAAAQLSLVSGHPGGHLGGRLVVQTSARRVELATLPAERAPAAIAAESGSWATVRSDRLRWALGAAARFADEGRGITVALVGGSIYTAATNGHAVMLARGGVQAGSAGASWAFRLSLVSAQEWEKLLGSDKAVDARLQVLGSGVQVQARNTWDDLSAPSLGHTAALRVGAVTLSERCATDPAGDLVALVRRHFGPAPEPVLAGEATTLRVAPERLVAALKAVAVTTEDTKDFAPMLTARATGVAFEFTTEVDAAVQGSTEERVEGLVTIGAPGAQGIAQDTAAANTRYLLAAAEVGVAHKGPDDVDLGFRCCPMGPGPGVGSAWFLRPTGHTLETAPWFALVMGAVR